MNLKEIKYSINSTIGTENQKSIDKIIEELINELVKN